jgi:CheY-like chemotaxis protein
LAWLDRTQAIWREMTGVLACESTFGIEVAVRGGFRICLIMSAPSDPQSAETTPDLVPKAASELNNLLQIMAGSSALIEKVKDDSGSSEKYLAMLRNSIERADQVAADLVERAGGAKEKSIINPELAPFVKSKKSTEPTQAKESILVVDDEPMALTLAERILTEAGYRVITAQSGFECLDIFRQRPLGFHLVMLDLTMPFMDGEETFRRLRDIRADVPVVLCTGFIHQDRLERLMASGLTGFLRKPLPPDEIVKLIRSMLQTIKYSGGNVSTRGMPAVI